MRLRERECESERVSGAAGSPAATSSSNPFTSGHAHKAPQVSARASLRVSVLCALGVGVSKG